MQLGLVGVLEEGRGEGRCVDDQTLLMARLYGCRDEEEVWRGWGR